MLPEFESIETQINKRNKSADWSDKIAPNDLEDASSELNQTLPINMGVTDGNLGSYIANSARGHRVQTEQMDDMVTFNVPAVESEAESRI